METLGAIRISEPLQQDSQKVPTTPSGTAPVPASLVQLHLSSWVRVISVGLALVEDLVMEGSTLMTQCGTHRGANSKVGALTVIMTSRATENNWIISTLGLSWPYTHQDGRHQRLSVAHHDQRI